MNLFIFGIVPNWIYVDLNGWRVRSLPHSLFADLWILMDFSYQNIFFNVFDSSFVKLFDVYVALFHFNHLQMFSLSKFIVLASFLSFLKLGYSFRKFLFS